MNQAVSTGIEFTAVDASGQRKLAVRDFPSTGKIRDLIKMLIPQLGLNTNDTAGRPLDYQVFSKQKACHLRGSETVGDILQDGDEVSLLPDIMAG